MKLKMFSVYDAKMSVYGNPWYEQREAGAIRSFSDAVNENDPKNMWHKHPEDYSLWLLGEYDTENGEITVLKPQNLINASALIELNYSDGKDAIKIHDRNMKVDIQESPK